MILYFNISKGQCFDDFEKRVILLPKWEQLYTNSKSKSKYFTPYKNQLQDFVDENKEGFLCFYAISDLLDFVDAPREYSIYMIEVDDNLNIINHQDITNKVNLLK